MNHPNPSEEDAMKYVVLIHSNPQPWGHPTSEFLAAHQQLPAEEQRAAQR